MSVPERPERGPHPAHRSRRIPARAGAGLPFATSAMRLPVTIVAEWPALLAAAVEDLCWSIAAADWIRREPGTDAAETGAWSLEGTRLEAERQRIQARLFDIIATW